jgi:hypothetical protein
MKIANSIIQRHHRNQHITVAREFGKKQHIVFVLKKIFFFESSSNCLLGSYKLFFLMTTIIEIDDEVLDRLIAEVALLNTIWDEKKSSQSSKVSCCRFRWNIHILCHHGDVDRCLCRESTRLLQILLPKWCFPSCTEAQK